MFLDPPPAESAPVPREKKRHGMTGTNPIAAAVRAVRRAQRLTQAQLARRAKVARTALIRLEAGGPVYGSTRQAVVQALGYTLGNDLLIAAAKLEALTPPPAPEPAAPPAMAERAAALAAPREPWPGSTR